jgi:Tol biopolymer transport system component
VEDGDPELGWRSTPTPDPDPYGVPLASAPTSLWWLSTGELAVVVLSDKVAAGYPYVPEGPNALHIIDVESKRHEKIPGIYENAYGDLVWSPDDSRFAVAHEDEHHILVHDRVTGSTVEIRPKLNVGKAWYINYVAWSPEGDRLLAGVQQGSDSSGPIFALLSMDPDGTSVEVLTPWTDKLYPR